MWSGKSSLTLSETPSSRRRSSTSLVESSNLSDSDYERQTCFLLGITFQNQFLKVNSRATLFKLFMNLPNQLDTQDHREKVELRRKCRAGRQHQVYNRSVHDLPFDKNRVRLQLSNDYINASHIVMEPADRRYILAQTPMQNPEDSIVDEQRPRMDTIGKFWFMVLQHRASAVVHLARSSGGSPGPDCFPDNVEENLEAMVQLPSARLVKVVVTTLQKDVCSDWEHRRLRVQCHDETFEFVHFCIRQFSSICLPEAPGSFVRFLVSYTELFERGSERKPNEHLIIVNCEGLDLCGLFILADLCLLRVRQRQSLTVDLDVLNLANRLRDQRAGALSTSAQLKLVFDIINWGAKSLEEFEYRLSRQLSV